MKMASFVVTREVLHRDRVFGFGSGAVKKNN